MRENEAVSLLLKLTGRETLNAENMETSFPRTGDQDGHREQSEAARKTVSRLGCLPLGIYQAANLIVNESCLFTEFLSDYDDRDLFTWPESARLFRNPNEEPYHHTLLNVWSKNFDSLSEDCQDLVNMLSFLNPDAIGLDMLARAADMGFVLGGTARAATRGSGKFAKQKGMILRSSLLDQNEATRTLSMHRLVQADCQQRMMAQNRQQKAFHMATSLVHYMWPVAPRKNRHRPDLWPAQARLLPHVFALCRFYENSRRDHASAPLIGSVELAEVLYNASWYVGS